MNDFTEEELLIILLDLKRRNFRENSKTGQLINKIQSMIDNYCEPTNSMIVAQIKYWNEELTKRENSAIQGDVKCL